MISKLEKIILAPGVSGNELSKTMAMNNVNNFNVRICGDKELARIGLMRSGVSVTKEFLNSREENNIIAEAVEGIEYFGKPSNSDIQQIANAIRRMRSFVTDRDEATKIEECLNKGEFMDKNSALLSVYKKFIEIITSHDMLDSISLVRLAIEKCSPIENAEFITLEEFPLTPLQTKLIETLSGGKYKSSNLFELFKTDSSATVKINSFKECYGAPNEVETILDDIYRNNSLDKCSVAVTDTRTYSQLFFDYAILYNIPVTFGCGIPITNSNPAKLLKLYNSWTSSGFYSGMVLNEMLNSNTFHKGVLKKEFAEKIKDFDEENYSSILRNVKNILVNIRLTNNDKENTNRLNDYKKVLAEQEIENNNSDYNTCIPYLEVLSNELTLPPEEFIKKYAYIRKSDKTCSEKLLMLLDNAAVNAIYDEMRLLRLSKVEQNDDAMIHTVLGLSVLKSRCEQGSLYVTSIDGAISYIRDNLYIAGLSASKYPGSPTENYLLLDNDIKGFGDDLVRYTSRGKIKAKRDRLFNLVEIASALGSKVNVSYPGLNVSELKRDNRSSLIYELYRKEHGQNASSDELDKDTIRIDYFEPAISSSRKVGEEYNAGNKVTQQDIEEREQVTNTNSLEKEYSPTVLETYFTCPRRFKLRYILGIKEPAEENEFEIISANESGNLAHSLMEELANSSMSRDEFIQLSETYFDRFIKTNPPLVKQNVQNEKNQFIDMMRNAYDQDKHREVILKEEDLHCEHESGVKLFGRPDRVERLEDGSVVIVDYKTGRNVKHVENDFKTCLQIIIYAYLMEKAGEKIDHCEYRYIRLNETVPCAYNDYMKEYLNKWLVFFKEKMEENVFLFPINADSDDDDKNPCLYCKYGAICGKTEKKKDGEEQ